MDENCKKRFAVARKLIQEKNYSQAKDELEVMSYKYSKVFQVHLMLGLCYTKLNMLQQAQRAYLQVLDLVPDQANALKQLCEIYTQRGDLLKGAKYLELSTGLLRKGDPKKYREAVVKLIDLYEKELNMQKIDKLFQQYCTTEQKIDQDFAHLACAYFRVGVKNQCFFLQKFQVMGVRGESLRLLVPTARESMNRLMIQIVDYLRAVALKYQMSKKDIANSIMQMKMYFPQCASLLLVMLFDQYCVGQMAYSSQILQELYLLCQAHFDQAQNTYHNLRFTAPQVFAVCMILAKEYLCFFKEFFTLEPLLDQYYNRLVAVASQLEGTPIRDDYRKKIDKFILKECRGLAELSKHGNISDKLQIMKQRIESLDGSYLQEVIAKIALHSFTSYTQLSDMKYKLKVRIKQLLPECPAPHLYKYYYDYLFKMARVFKSLDEELPVRDVLEYIVQHDPNDLRYQLELIWFNFSMAVKGLEQQDRQQLAAKCLASIQDMLPNLEHSLKSQAYRRIIILKITTGDNNIEADLKAALDIQRSFQNLQCGACYYFWKGELKQALFMLREAYRLNQGNYHTNRLFFLALYRCDYINDAFSFLQQLQPSFTGVFWVNYFIGINKINQKHFLESEGFINKALEAFQAGSVDNFRFGYQKVYDIGPFSLLHLVQQNEYSIFFDQIVLPEQFIYKDLPPLSNLYFTRDLQYSRMRLFLKEGELLKILGRTKSSLNYLQTAFVQAQNLNITPQTPPKLLIDHVLVRKQYATILFYSSRLRQAQQMLVGADIVVKWLLPGASPLVLKLDNEVQALFFQISISRLSAMMRFQSHEAISDYLSVFLSHISHPAHPSLTFLKNQYQFHILQFMHTRHQLTDIELSVAQFLAHFKLDFSSRLNESFAVRLQQLGQSERKFVRQCIEDYYIVRGLSTPASEEELLHMLSLFPRSSTLCVLLGAVSKQVKLRTACFLKVIQLDRQSSISMDILAGLYLKQKNYLAAAKLFLKSLERDVLNVKCYLGLAVCLLCLVVRAVQGADEQVDIVRQCLVRINSYMQFIRLNDPSQHYHILGFLRLLLNDQPSPHFRSRFVLQAVHTHSPAYRDSLLAELYHTATQHTQKCNFWSTQHQIQILDSYIKTNIQSLGTDHVATAGALAERAKETAEALGKVKGSVGKQIALKHFQKGLHQLGLTYNLAIKIGKFEAKLFGALLCAGKAWEESFKIWGFDQNDLEPVKVQIKGYLFQYMLLGEWSTSYSTQIEMLFSTIRTYRHLATHYKQIPQLQKEISRQMLLNPANQQIRQIYTGYMVSQKGDNLRRAKLGYRLQLINNNNINTTYDEYTYKKLIFLYRDPNAIILYLQRQWGVSGARSEQNVRKWVGLANYIVKKDDSNQNWKQKATRLKLQMLAFLRSQYGIQSPIPLQPAQQLKFAKLVAVQTIMQKIDKTTFISKDLSSLSKLFNTQPTDFDWWILTSLINYIARRVQTTINFQKFLQHFQEYAPSKRLKGFILLIRFLLAVRREPTSEEDLVSQIVNLSQLCGSCEGIVSPSTQVILECSRCLLLSSWEQMEAELSKAVETIKVSSYSDQVLINFFEVLKQYKLAQANPNGEGVMQSFVYLADSQLQLVRDPLLRGLVLGLKGMLLGLARQGQPQQLKRAMLLSPSAAKALVTGEK